MGSIVISSTWSWITFRQSLIGVNEGNAYSFWLVKQLNDHLLLKPPVFTKSAPPDILLWGFLLCHSLCESGSESDGPITGVFDNSRRAILLAEIVNESKPIKWANFHPSCYCRLHFLQILIILSFGRYSLIEVKLIRNSRNSIVCDGFHTHFFRFSLNPRSLDCCALMPGQFLSRQKGLWSLASVQ